jgi:hypothetical protein
MKSCLFSLCVLMLVAPAGASGAEPEEMALANKKFASLPNPKEAYRQKHLLELSKLRGSLANNASGEDCFKVDAEIRRYPAPANTEGYTKLMAGKWSSPRHEYIYRANGTWSMLPEEEGATRGRWRIEGNRFMSSADIEPEDTQTYTILLLTKDDFIFTDGETVFYEERIRDHADQDSRR